MYRAGQARLLGDVDGTMAHARRALDLVGEDDHLGRGAAAALLGLAYWTRGDLETASLVRRRPWRELEQAGYPSDVVGLAIALADIRMTQGRLTEAMRIFTAAWTSPRDAGRPSSGARPTCMSGISEILRERNDLAGASSTG